MLKYVQESFGTLVIYFWTSDLYLFLIQLCTVRSKNTPTVPIECWETCGFRYATQSGTERFHQLVRSPN